MQVKLLDRADINRYGATVTEVPNHIAENLIRENKAIRFVGNHVEPKSVDMPPVDKMVWQAPEKKALENTPKLKERFPGKGMFLFPEHIIER